MFVIEAAVKALGKVDAKMDGVEAAQASLDKTIGKMKALPPQKTTAELTQMRLAAERLDGEARADAFIAVSKAVEENARISTELVALGRLAGQRRAALSSEVKKSAQRVHEGWAKELESLLRGKLPLYLAHPLESPDRIAEIVALAELLNRSFFPEGLGDFLGTIDPDIARVASAKRQASTVTV